MSSHVARTVDGDWLKQLAGHSVPAEGIWMVRVIFWGCDVTFPNSSFTVAPCMVGESEKHRQRRYSIHNGAFKAPGAHVHKLDLDSIPAYYRAGTAWTSAEAP